jgi:hypothetical protein
MIHGPYGEFKVLVNGEAVIDAGPLSAVGLVPSNKRVIEAVRSRLTHIARSQAIEPTDRSGDSP